MTFKTNDEIVNGAFVRSSWIFGVIDTGGRGRLIRHDSTGVVHELPQTAQLFAHQFRMRATHFASSGERLILADMRWPFAWVVLDATGKAVRRGSPFVSDTLFRIGNDSVRATSLVAMPVFTLDTGFVQALVDVRSDLRMLLLYDASGRRIRLTTINAPIGILAVDVPRRELLILRRSDVLEVVTYGWRWGMHTLHGRHQ